MIYHIVLLPFLGYPMYDGFDDSSTFMSKEVAVAFADNYDKPVCLSVLVSAVCCTLVILITLSIYLYIYVSIYLSVYLSIYVSIYLSISLYIYVYVFQPKHLSICLSFH